MADDSTHSGADKSPEKGDESDKEAASKKLLDEAKARFALCVEAEKENRAKAADDRKFRAGDQWPAQIRQQREDEGRPCLTINKMPQFEQQVTNDQRQNRPSIKVHPVDDQGDIETGKVFQGIIKNIEVTSSADTARDTAFENAVRGSYGFYRVVTDYVSPDSFDQEIRIKRVRDPDTVYLDPNHQEPDGSDSEYGFVTERVPKARFISEFGESKLAKGGADWATEASLAPEWVQHDTIVVAEYFYKEYRSVTLALLSTGEVVDKAEIQALPEGVTIVKERQAQLPTVQWCKLNGVEVLEDTEWPGQWIPILPVYGAELVVEGKLIRESLIRHSKDPARMYNFWKSAETEAITLAPKAPFIAAEGQIEDFRGIWENANRKTFSVLPYKPISIDGSPVPPPQRNSFEPAVQAITQASMMAADEVKATMGLYDASLGARSNETSGVAIQRRNQQAQTSNFHFTDNLNRTIRHEGRILVDLIPKIYDTARIARIIGEDGEQKLVKINQEFQNEAGEDVEHDLSRGKYDVTIDTGPSYQTRRQEAASAMLDLSKSMPVVGQAAPDLIVKSLDVPGASEMADRLKKTLPPNLIDDPKSKQIPPQVQAQMAQMSQMIEKLTTQLHAATDPLEMKRIELESRERIAFAELETKAAIEHAKLMSNEAVEVLAHQIAELDARTKVLGMNQPFPGSAGAQEEQPMNAPEQNPPMPADGALGADVGEPGEHPTGGDQPPGLPMEQSSDDPEHV